MEARHRAAMHGGAKPPSLFIDDEEHFLPWRYEVCPLCQGRGRHTNPAIDAHGISPEEFAADPDFAADYFGGVYDVTCYECKGHNVVPVVDRDALDADMLAAYDAQITEEAEFRSVCEAERRAGA